MLEGTGSALCLSFAARPAWRTRHVPLRLAPLTPKAAERVRLGRRRARSSCDLPALRSRFPFAAALEKLHPAL